jgi:hypothetical protein
MWLCVDLVWSDVSEERIASIFRVEKSASEESAWAGLSLSPQPLAHAGSSLARDGILRSHCCENLKSYNSRINQQVLSPYKIHFKKSY